MTTRGEARARHRRRGCWYVVVVSGTGDVWPSAAVLFILASNPTPTQKTDILASGRGRGGAEAGLSHLRSPGLSFLNRLPLKLIQWAATVTWNIVISAVVVVVVVVVASHNQ